MCRQKERNSISVVDAISGTCHRTATCPTPDTNSAGAPSQLSPSTNQCNANGREHKTAELRLAAESMSRMERELLWEWKHCDSNQDAWILPKSLVQSKSIGTVYVVIY